MGEKSIEETAGEVGKEREGELQWTSAILYTSYSLPLYVVVVNKYVPNTSKQINSLVFYSHTHPPLFYGFISRLQYEFGLQENRLCPINSSRTPENQISTCGTFSGGTSLKRRQIIIS